ERGHDSLMDVKAYQEVRRRAAFPDGKPAQLSWFIDPQATVKAMRLMSPSAEEKRSNTLTILSEEGFSAVQAIGGAGRLDDGPFDQLSRVAVYAPPPHTRALAALNFPNQALPGPAAWVP